MRILGRTRGDMDNLHFMTARQLAHLIKQKEISCLELLEHFLTRTETHNPKLNAIIWMDADAARSRAKSAASSSVCR